MPFAKWKKDTWYGIAAVASGALCQSVLGQVALWGNIVVYLASKYKSSDPDLTIQFALIAFPITYATGSIAMQLGEWMMLNVTVRMQLLCGLSICIYATYMAQFCLNFDSFLWMYSVVFGIGFGICYFLPILCAWSYFSNRPMTAGSILCWFSITAIYNSGVCTEMLNPSNERPSVIVHNGKNIERFYDVDSDQVKKIPEMLSWLSFFGFCCMALAVPLINKKGDDTGPKKLNPNIVKLQDYLHEDFVDKTDDSTTPVRTE
jgi:hypothetical protein